MNNSSQERMAIQRAILSILVATWISFASAHPDGASLLAIKQAWNLNQSWWQGDNPCHGWERVSCDASNRVTYLNLSNTGIEGRIPSEMSNLDHLTNLDLSNARNSAPPHNLISGDLSPLGPLTGLLHLNVSFNHIQLDAFPVVLYKLTNLLTLKIDNNNISGPVPKELAQYTNLQFLYVGNNSMTGPIPKELGSLANLQELSMWNNNLQSSIPPEFGNLGNLTYLNLHDCGLYGGLPMELGNLKNIKNMSLYRNQLTGAIPDAWKGLTSLKGLTLHYNYLTKTVPAQLMDLPNLYNLSIGYNLFYGSLSLENANLSYMDVTCNFFHGPIPAHPQRLSLNSSGNCFDNTDPNERIKCYRGYYNCDAFSKAVPNGGCPSCPGQQVLSDPLTCVCSLNLPTDGSSARKKSKLIGSVVGVGLFIGFLFIIWGIWFGKHKKSSVDFWESPEGVQRYLYRDLSRATNGFNSTHEIGLGGFGKVYLGVVDGKQVAIKRAHASSIQSSSGFRNEVILLSRLHHRNLVRLLGFCEEKGIQILVYEYMNNGNLHTLLFKNVSGRKLDWLKRLDIALGVAQGLEYLHSFADPPVIHRDVKPSNVLLDDNMVAKLSDFGISKVAAEAQTQFATRPAGTVGYIDPQYILREHLTTASDVYSFGMVLLELVSGQKSIDNTRLDEHNLVEWAKVKLEKEGVKSIIDTELGDKYPEKIYYDIVRLAIDCASFESEGRPSMKVVLSILDACRWSVVPQVLEGTEKDPFDSFKDYEKDGLITGDNSGVSFAKDTQSSFAEGSSHTFSFTRLLPR